MQNIGKCFHENKKKNRGAVFPNLYSQIALLFSGLISFYLRTKNL